MMPHHEGEAQCGVREKHSPEGSQSNERTQGWAKLGKNFIE